MRYALLRKKEYERKSIKKREIEKWMIKTDFYKYNCVLDVVVKVLSVKINIVTEIKYTFLPF